MRKNGELLLSQRSYIKEIFEYHGMIDCGSVVSPIEVGNVMELSNIESLKYSSNTLRDFSYRECVGHLLYLSTKSRPDISFIAGLLSQFVSNPK